ncbi:binder of sperm protein homolog 1 [Rousettus aegyptiacus]|uniref:binder of sperm protein homolog 1 n=1 Tax=Rousettus aegyptiacus TaxID=9407 RepID=UPI00168CFCCD|nr:binder of sperm protein homolog 1 [Rousettus aegyptiacus]
MFLVGRHRNSEINVGFKFYFSVAMTSFPETKVGKCVFPFYYKNGIYYDCVKFQAKSKWCSLNKTFIGNWKYCLKDDFAKCAFPFWFGRMIYWECTEDGNLFGRKWCSLTKNFNRDQIWKYCDSY